VIVYENEKQEESCNLCSGSLYNEAKMWERILKHNGYKVIRNIKKLERPTLNKYRSTHKSNYKKIVETGILFVLNLDKSRQKNI